MYICNIGLFIFELVSCTLRNIEYSKKPSRVQLAIRFESSFVRINKASRNPVTMRLERSSSFVFCLSEEEGPDVLVRSSLK